jgi:hypothetical protein
VLAIIYQVGKEDLVEHFQKSLARWDRTTDRSKSEMDVEITILSYYMYFGLNLDQNCRRFHLPRLLHRIQPGYSPILELSDSSKVRSQQYPIPHVKEVQNNSNDINNEERFVEYSRHALPRGPQGR